MGSIYNPNTCKKLRNYLRDIAPSTLQGRSFMYDPYMAPQHPHGTTVPFEGLVCTRCDSSVLDREVCKCGHVGLIIDEDYKMHIYTEDPTVIRLATIYLVRARRPRMQWLHAKPSNINRLSPRNNPSTAYDYKEFDRVYGPALVTGNYIKTYNVSNTPTFFGTRVDHRSAMPPERWRHHKHSTLSPTAPCAVKPLYDNPLYHALKRAEKPF